MPLFELLRVAKAKLDSNPEKSNSYSNELPLPEDNFAELVWKNGQVMMQGQCCRGRKTPSDDNSLHSNGFRPSFNDTNTRMGKPRSPECGLSEFPASIPSGEIGLNPDEDIVPWLNYPIGGGSLQNAYCSDILPEFTGVSVNGGSLQHNYESIHKSCTRLYRNSNTSSLQNNVSSGQVNTLKFPSCTILTRTTRASIDQPEPTSPLQSQSSLPSLRSRAVDSIGPSASTAICPAVSEHSTRLTAPVAVHSSVKVQRLDSGLPTSTAGLTNFPCFTRPAYLSKDNIDDRGKVGSSGLPCKLQSDVSDKISGVRSLNHTNPKFVTLSGSGTEEKRACNQNLVENDKVDGEKADAKKCDDTLSSKDSRAVSMEVASKNDKFADHSNKEKEINRILDNERTTEPVAGTSSVCSDNSVGRGAPSDDQKPNLKRKSRDTEESDGPSEEVEEELVPVKKQNSTRGSTARRSRAAEVHNLSERRRRDRINEKMRALQELIPNCNKVDKASMLDEAIEYLKSLQLQVQVMTMGAGMYMPQTMLPTGIQHLQPAHFAQMPHMAVRMGAGMGFAMGMLDINSASSGCQTIQVPMMQGAQFPSPLMSSPPAFHGMPGPNLQMFGLPGQGLPFSLPRLPFFPLSGGPVMRSVPGFKTHGVPGVLENPDSAQPLSSNEQVHNTNKQAGQSGVSSSLTNHLQAGLVQDNSQSSDAELVNEKDAGRARASRHDT